MHLPEFLSGFEDGTEVTILIEQDELNGRTHYFLIVPDDSDPHDPDADAYVIEDLQGTVSYPGGE